MKRILILSASLLLLCNVGISQKMKIRSEKPEDHVVSMMSFNIRHGNGMDRQVDLGRIAAEIALVGADVVALQEVDKGTNRVGGVDSPAEIAKLAGGYVASFASAIDLGGGKYGNAILSKKAPLSVESVPLPGKEEPRVMLVAEFEDYYFCSLHLSLDSASRVDACRKIAKYARKKSDGKLFFIAGDFNLGPRSLEMKVLSEDFATLSAYEVKTFPSDNPDRTLDYIMVYRGGAGKKLLKKLEKGSIGVASWVQPEKMASDHRPIITLIFKGENCVTEKF